MGLGQRSNFFFEIVMKVHIFLKKMTLFCVRCCIYKIEYLQIFKSFHGSVLVLVGWLGFEVSSKLEFSVL